MTSNVTVITATIPGREELLERARRSVGEQTVKPHAHWIKLDDQKAGGAATKNRLFDFVSTEWFMVLDDDDFLLPNHIETLLSHSDGYDIVGSWHEGAWPTYNRPLSETVDENNVLRHGIPHTAIVRSALFARLGKFSIQTAYDTKFWEAAVAAGAKVNIVEEKTWHYDTDQTRPHESLGGLPWASENA